jgi:nitroreductase
MLNSQPITKTIPQRYSCRTYQDRPIEAEGRGQLQAYLDTLRIGPLGADARFKLVAATENDQRALRGLGTYGFIRGAAGYIIGAVRPGKKNLEDYGYLMEQAILAATDMGLGTCWLGGSFTQSSFARKIEAAREEVVPAVTAMGYIPEDQNTVDVRLRRSLGADRRYPWSDLFFLNAFGQPLAPETAGLYAQPLEMLRLGPSASNRQPWRVIRIGEMWHFYVQRTPGYGKGSLLFGLMRLADLQRVDIGIAMCHFELTAKELGLSGQWKIADPGLALPSSTTEYVVSWEETGQTSK